MIKSTLKRLQGLILIRKNLPANLKTSVYVRKTRFEDELKTLWLPYDSGKNVNRLPECMWAKLWLNQTLKVFKY
jgi:hypothetical protein